MSPALRFSDTGHLAIAIVFLALLVLAPLIDPDYFWHLRTGQYLVEHGALPATDIFSHTFAGRPWVLHEWLFEVVLYACHAALGDFGVKLLVATLGTATLAVCHATVRRMLARPTLALVVTLACFALVSPGISPRPQLVTFLLFAVYIRVLLGFRYFGETRGLVLLPLLMVPWVNSHGGFAVGIALPVLFTACEWLRFRAAEHRDEAARQRLRLLAIATAATVLASLANPYFAGHWLYPLTVVGQGAHSVYITEWRSPDFHELRFKGFLLFAGAFFLLTLYRARRPDITEVALPLFFLATAFVVARHIPLAVIAALPFMALSLAEQPLARMLPPHWQAACAAWYSRTLGRGEELGNREFVLNAVVLAVATAAAAAYYPVHAALSAKVPNAYMPTEAVDFIVREDIHGRLFNAFDHGGYLIHRLYPGLPVFIDGRADMYGDAFFREYLAISAGTAQWATLFDRHLIDVVLIQRNEALRQLLVERGDFVLVHDDALNSVLVRNDPRYAGVIARHGHRAAH